MSFRPHAAAPACAPAGRPASLPALTLSLKNVLDIGMMRTYDEMMNPGGPSDAPDGAPDNAPGEPPPPAKLAKPPVSSRAKKLVRYLVDPFMRNLNYEMWGLPGTKFDASPEVLAEIKTVYLSYIRDKKITLKKFKEFVKDKLSLNEFESKLIDSDMVDFNRYSNYRFFLQHYKLSIAVRNNNFEFAVAVVHYFHMTLPNFDAVGAVADATYGVKPDSSAKFNYQKDWMTVQNDYAEVKQLFERVANETPGFVVTKNIFETPPDYKNVLEFYESYQMTDYFLKLKTPVGDEVMLKEKAQDENEWEAFVEQARTDSRRGTSYPESLMKKR